MSPRGVTGVLFGAMVLVVSAPASLAKPVSTHVAQMSWSQNEFGVTTNGSFVVTVDESGSEVVELTMTESSSFDCGGGQVGIESRSITHTGPADLTSTFGRHVSDVSIIGSLDVHDHTSTWCPGTGTVETAVSHSVAIALSGTALERATRSRDSLTGTRFLKASAGVELSLGGDRISDVALLIEEIARS